MEVITVNVYSGIIGKPVDVEKMNQICKEGWFPVSVINPGEVGVLAGRELTAVFVKTGKDKKLDEIESKLDKIIAWFSGGDGSAKPEKKETPISGKGTKKGK